MQSFASLVLALVQVRLAPVCNGTLVQSPDPNTFDKDSKLRTEDLHSGADGF